MVYKRLLILVALFTSIQAFANVDTVVRDTLLAEKYIIAQNIDELSPEAVLIINKPLTPVPNYYTYRDTTIFSQLFTPIIYDISKLFDEAKYVNTVSNIINLKNIFGSPKEKDLLIINRDFGPQINSITSINSPIFTLLKNNYKTFIHILTHKPGLVTMTSSMLPEKIKYDIVEAPQYDDRFEIKSTPKISLGKETFETVEIEPIYWTKNFESRIQFSQTYISSNWHKGGTSNLNLFTRNYFNLTYSKDRVKWVNEIESKLGFYNAPNDTVNKYKISEDLLRLHTNFGLKANKQWYYTLDAELRSQLLKNKKENSTDLITAFLSPFAIDAGIGMKYELKKNFEGDRFRKLKFSANIAPFAISYIATLRDDIDKGRIGFEPDQRQLFSFGSTVKAFLDFDISQTVNWQSRFFYNTSYSRVETEWENTVSIALSRFFSTTLNVNLRFDDAIKNTGGTLKDLLQYTELFSFGFNYKL